MIINSTSCCPVVLVSIIVLTSLVGCSTFTASERNKNITIKRINSTSAKIMRVGLCSIDKENIILRGELRRRGAYLRGKIPGHLHIELVDQSGKTFKEAEFNYRRKNRKSRISLFSIPIPIEPASIGAVRVTHHDPRSHIASLTKSPWRNVNTSK